MLKVIKSAIVCDKCGSQLKSEIYEYFCDNCKMKTSGDIFNVEIFWKGDNKDAENLEFCSLKCVREWLLNFPYNKEEVHFVTLPYISNVDDLQTFLRNE